MKSIRLKFILTACLLSVASLLSAQSELAEFPGGKGEYIKFLQANISYPQKAMDNNESGLVYVSFDVEEDGSVTDVKVERSVSPSLDAEALRVMKMMPKWKPATEDGTPVKSRVTRIITFKMWFPKK